jgi:hypothetical protein
LAQIFLTRIVVRGDCDVTCDLVGVTLSFFDPIGKISAVIGILCFRITALPQR